LQGGVHMLLFSIAYILLLSIIGQAGLSGTKHHPK
jgi:hypothetical protein